MAKKITAIGAAPTEEQKKELAIRQFVTKRNSIAEAYIFNSVRGQILDKDEALELVDTAIAVGDHYMEKAFGISPLEK